MLWSFLAVMTTLAVALLLAPLIRARRVDAPRGAYDLEVYRDQLGEVERDLEQGSLSPDEAAGARLEVERRMLAAAERAGDATALSWRWRRLSAVGLCLGLPAAAAALYLWLGSPGTPSQPLAQRPGAFSPGVEAPPAGPAPPGDIGALTERLAARLEREPGDLRGWLLLARSYWQLGRHAQAAAAYRSASDLRPGDPNILMGLGESLVMAARGVVTPRAAEAFEKTLATRPAHPGARFYLALAEAQAGRPRVAFDQWLALAKETPAEAPWRPVLLEQLGIAADDLGVDLEDVLPASPAASTPPPVARGPTETDIEAAREMPAEDRAAFIQSMVARLAERMAENPGDRDGWMRLGRAWRVLGETARARDAYARAAALGPDDTRALVAYGLTIVEAADAGGPVPEEAARLFRRVVELDPDDADALWFVGLAEAQAGRRKAAIGFWRRLLVTLDPGSPQYADLRQRIDALEPAP